MSDITTISEIRITAEEINHNCPQRLEELAKLAATHFAKAQKYADKADQHYISMGQYLADAKKLCDDDAFASFQEKFFPTLKKSRAYEILAIAENRKSPEETRANTRERVAKHRAKKAACNSVTVTDEPTQTDVSTRADEVPAAADPEKPRNGGFSPRDLVKRNFTIQVTELEKTIRKRSPCRFLSAAVQTTTIAQVGRFLTAVAELQAATRNSGVADPAPCDAPAEDMVDKPSPGTSVTDSDGISEQVVARSCEDPA